MRVRNVKQLLLDVCSLALSLRLQLCRACNSTRCTLITLEVANTGAFASVSYLKNFPKVLGYLQVMQTKKGTCFDMQMAVATSHIIM